MNYYLTETGNGLSPDGTLPPGAVECTQEQYANAGAWMITDGAIVAAPEPVLTLSQQAAAAAGSGLTIALTGAMTLAATLFPTDAATQSKLAAVAIVINTTGGFPDGSSTYPLKDASGAWHTLTVAQYKIVAGAIASYVAALDLIADGNPLGASALPADTITLAI